MSVDVSCTAAPFGVQAQHVHKKIVLMNMKTYWGNVSVHTLKNVPCIHAHPAVSPCWFWLSLRCFHSLLAPRLWSVRICNFSTIASANFAITRFIYWGEIDSNKIIYQHRHGPYDRWSEILGAPRVQKVCCFAKGCENKNIQPIALSMCATHA